jgi:hypothetical protein
MRRVEMNWDLTDMVVEGMYLDQFKVRGRVELSRVAYGGDVKHTIVLDTPINVYGAERDRVVISHKEVSRVSDR